MSIQKTLFSGTDFISDEQSGMQIFGKKIVKPIIVVLLLNIIFAIIYLIFCNEPEDWKGLDDDEEPLMMKLFNRFYYSMTTTSAVGYGDISPKSIKCRTIVMIHFIFIMINVLTLFI